MSSQEKIDIRNLTKVYDGSAQNRTTVFEDINLAICDGQFRLAGGSERVRKEHSSALRRRARGAQQREILLAGEKVTGPGPDLAIVFQEFALFPWRSVLRNVEYGTGRLAPMRRICSISP